MSENVPVFFFQQKGKKSPDYEHCMWGEGRIFFVSQLFCLGFTNFWARQQSKPIDCVRLCSVNKLCRGFENKKNTSYIKVTRSSKSSFSLIFNISLTKNQEFRNQKFDLARLSEYFCAGRFELVRLPNSVELNL